MNRIKCHNNNTNSAIAYKKQTHNNHYVRIKILILDNTYII